MRLSIHLTAAVLLSTSSTPLIAKPAHHAAFQLNGTTWVFTDKKGTRLRESIDADGNYIVNTVGGKHVDHGTAVMRGKKACFTSAMTKEGEVCWTTKPTKIGRSFITISDKGDRQKVTRVRYSKLSMPS